MWWDDDLEKWRISTLKYITPDEWVPQLFWRFIDEKKLNTELWKNYTYVFELCCEENRIVTKYSQDQVFLIAIRNNVHK